MTRPVFQPTPQPVVLRSDEVRVSAVSVYATQRRVDRTLSTVSDSVIVVTEELQRDSWTRSGSDLPRQGVSVVSVNSAVNLVGEPASAFLHGTKGCANIAGGGGRGCLLVAPPAVLPSDVAVGVTSPAVAGAASPAHLVEVVVVDVHCFHDFLVHCCGGRDLSQCWDGVPRPTVLGLSP